MQFTITRTYNIDIEAIINNPLYNLKTYPNAVNYAVTDYLHRGECQFQYFTYEEIQKIKTEVEKNLKN